MKHARTHLLALTLALLAGAALAAAPATATHTITLTIPYVLHVHADAPITAKVEQDDSRHLVLEARTPLTIHLATNDRWELILRTQRGQARTLTGTQGHHTLTGADLDHPPLEDGELITISVHRRPQHD